MFDNQLVSVIIPCLNSGRFLEKTIKSVLNQTYKQFEIIFIDNNSQDNTREIIATAQSVDPRIITILLDTTHRAGPSRNIGIERARGRYLAFLDSDDQWSEDKLNQQLDLMASSKAPFSFTGYKVIDEVDGPICDILNMPRRLTYDDFLKNTCIATSSVIIDRKAIPEFRFEDRPISEDYPTWLKTLKRGHCAVGLSGPFLRYRVVRSSLSSKKAKAAGQIWEIYRREEGLSLVRSVYCFFQYARRAFFKNLKMNRI
jgi:teichuronic acid biosynthesis glycosyltransferase TuaG